MKVLALNSSPRGEGQSKTALMLSHLALGMREAGAEVLVVGREAEEGYHSERGYPVTADVAAEAVAARDFDAVIIPGGYAPDRLRRYQAVLDLVQGVFEKGGIVAAICHAAWVPISAGILKGKRATCVSAIKDDLINAGATYLDQEVVVDGNLVTSRTPRDLPAYVPAIIAALDD